MKRYIATIIMALVMLLGTVSVTQAQMGTMMYNDDVSPTPKATNAAKAEEHTMSVDQAVQAILNDQGVKAVDKLDLSKITDDQWEVLGDAVMEQIHPGDAHEAMDEMMGGEGSESLRQMHINMGRAYLGYGSTNQAETRYGMMGRWNAATPGVGMMGYRTMNWNSGVWGWFGVIQAVTWIAGILFLVTGSAYFVSNLRERRSK